MPLPKDLEERFRRDLAHFQLQCPDLPIFEAPVFDLGDHPENYVDAECAFAAGHLFRLQPREILDIGSYRHFVLGLLAHFRVTTLDVRLRTFCLPHERTLTADAKALPLPDASFDLLLSLCALEHFGLGRYGDAIDGRADEKAMAEMIRVLRPGGHLIFSTTLNRAHSSIAFNAHRIYNRDEIHRLCRGLHLVEEKFYSHQKKAFGPLEEMTAAPQGWDVYCGCWRKDQRPAGE